MHSHSGEADFTRLWWIQGAISATLTAVGIDKITTKEPLQWGFNGWIFYFILFYFTSTTKKKPLLFDHKMLSVSPVLPGFQGAAGRMAQSKDRDTKWRQDAFHSL
jgi:hypothetical protein